MKDRLHSHPRVQAMSMAVKFSSTLKWSDVLYYYRFVVSKSCVFTQEIYSVPWNITWS